MGAMGNSSGSIEDTATPLAARPLFGPRGLANGLQDNRAITDPSCHISAEGQHRLSRTRAGRKAFPEASATSSTGSNNNHADVEHDADSGSWPGLTPPAVVAAEAAANLPATMPFACGVQRVATSPRLPYNARLVSGHSVWAYPNSYWHPANMYQYKPYGHTLAGTEYCGIDIEPVRVARRQDRYSPYSARPHLRFAIAAGTGAKPSSAVAAPHTIPPHYCYYRQPQTLSPPPPPSPLPPSPTPHMSSASAIQYRPATAPLLQLQPLHTQQLTPVYHAPGRREGGAPAGTATAGAPAARSSPTPAVQPPWLQQRRPVIPLQYNLQQHQQHGFRRRPTCPLLPYPQYPCHNHFVVRYSSRAAASYAPAPSPAPGHAS
ncbi:hypothetical protein Agub_g3694 [Astrephomene gubernaculifera]|uniref:Uncharacterized protein n=1 Tax=Astrephomene gubernaculifera TaxID=47775 RepID=A0AAD3DJ74_9CHLO|nr:hypothetical protein Agub_g3694 [Astrephomene gubernaculifera]